MNRAKTLTILTIPSLVAALALADGLTEEADSVAELRMEYEREEGLIDLSLSQFSLESARGEITPEEAQTAVDQWVSGNRQRLEEQAGRAELLDAVDPLPPARPQEEGPGGARMVPDDSPHALRHTELVRAWRAQTAQLRAQETDPERWQVLIDDWSRSPEGEALLREMWEIERDESLRRPLGTKPVELTADESAPPSAVATLEIHERTARRIMDIRAEHPDATPEEMQALVDARTDEFRGDSAEINPLLRQAVLEDLEAKVARLRTETAAAPQDTGTETETGAGAGEETEIETGTDTEADGDG